MTNGERTMAKGGVILACSVAAAVLVNHLVRRGAFRPVVDEQQLGGLRPRSCSCRGKR